MGPLIIDIQSTQMSSEEVAYLANPLVGGVILFSRNFTSSAQLKTLTKQISDLRPDCLIGVDHEGGRVQRFRTDGFTHLPAMGQLTSDQQAYDCGVIMAYELKQHGIHLNFAPVLDRDGVSQVIGDRGFDGDADRVIRRATQLIKGMESMGMPACGKHFPGHGSVVADSHIDCPVDSRSAEAIEIDKRPFAHLIEKQLLSAVMPAHVVYPQLDQLPAGYSPYWLQTVLKSELGFSGIIFSDDLSMKGASLAGDYPQRAIAAYQAGCDFLLLCNAPEQIPEVLSGLSTLSLRPQPDCGSWFTPLPTDGASMYASVKANLTGVA